MDVAWEIIKFEKIENRKVAEFANARIGNSVTITENRKECFV